MGSGPSDLFVIQDIPSQPVVAFRRKLLPVDTNEKGMKIDYPPLVRCFPSKGVEIVIGPPKMYY